MSIQNKVGILCSRQFSHTMAKLRRKGKRNPSIKLNIRIALSLAILEQRKLPAQIDTKPWLSFL